MSDVIIAGLLMAGLIGLSVGLIIAISRDHWWSKVLSLVICCAIFFGFGCAVGQEEVNDRDVISHLFDLMYDYEQEYAISNIGEEYSMSQVRDTSNLLAALIGSDKMRLENK